MCLTIPPPPPGVNTAVVDQPTNVPMTRRQRLEVHMTNDSCAACHKFMDPLGFPLENFDAIGKYRTTDNGLPVDPTGSFDGVAVADANGLGVAASQSVTVAQCLVRKYYGVRRRSRRAGRGRERAEHAGDGLQGVGFQDARPDSRRRRRTTRSRSSPLNPRRTVNPMAIKPWIDERFSRACWRPGATVTIPLPLLQIMLNGNGTAHAQTMTPVSPLFVTWFFGNGSLPGKWKPAKTGTGTNWDLSPQLQPLAALKSYLTVISGLTNNLVVGGNEHPTGSSGATTGAPLNGNAVKLAVDQSGRRRNSSRPALRSSRSRSG